MGNHVAAGTPRGFNLANMPFGMTGNNMQNGMNFQSLFNPAITGNFDSGFGHDDRNPGGAMRRGAGRFNARTGPYDRQQRDGRNGRFNGTSGRLTPPPRGGRPGGVARFGDGGPGPVQSTQGRSIKSYEDLDAVGNGGGGELNY